MRKTIYRTKDPQKLAAHQRAWEALTVHPIHQLLEQLFKRLSDLQTWQPSAETLKKHLARYESGKPEVIWELIDDLRNQLSATPENKTWFNTYIALYHE